MSYKGLKLLCTLQKTMPRRIVNVENLAYNFFTFTRSVHNSKNLTLRLQQ